MKNSSITPTESTPRIGNAAVGGQADSLGAPGARKRQPRIAPDLRILPPVSEREKVMRKRRVATTRGRVLIMDGHPMVEEWIGTLLGGEADLVFAGHATDLANTASLVARGHPSLVLLEIAKDIPGSLEIVRALKAEFPKLRMLVFSSCDEIAHSVQVLHAGAHGFVSKTASGTELMRAIRQVLDDGVYLSSAMIGRLVAGAPDTPATTKTGPDAVLSHRELQVFAFIGEGLHPTEIAQRISLSVKTVESYLVRIRQKLSLRDARALFKDAVKWSKARDRDGER